MIKKIIAFSKSGTTIDTMLSFFGNFVTAIGGLIFTILLARAMNPGEFGIVMGLLSAASIISSLADLGVSSVLTNTIPKKPEIRRELISEALSFQLLVGMILMVTTISLYQLNPHILWNQSLTTALGLALLIFVYVINAYCQNLMRAERLFGKATVMQVTETGVKVALLIAVVAGSVLNTEKSVYVSIIASVVATVWAFYIYKGQLSLDFSFSKLRTEISFGFWMAVNRSFGVLVSRADVVLLNSLSGSYQAGIFAAASRLAMVFSLLVSSLGSVISVRFAGFENKGQIKKYLKKLVLIVVLLVGMMIISAVVSPFIILSVFGKEYIEAASVYKGLTVAMIPFIISLLTITPLIYSFGLARMSAILVFIQVALLLGIEIVTLPTLGAWGAVIALFVSNMVVLVISGYLLITRLKTKNK